MKTDNRSRIAAHYRGEVERIPVPLPPDRRADSPARGIDHLTADPGLRKVVSNGLSDAALMLGKSIVKE